MDSHFGLHKFPVVLIVDPVELVRAGMRGTLGDAPRQIGVVLEAPTLEEAHECVAGVGDAVGLVILGPQVLKEGDALMRFRQRYARTPFALLIEQFDEATVVCGHALDVIGFIHMASSEREICDAVQCMLSGQVYLPRSVRPYLQCAPKGRRTALPYRTNHRRLPRSEH
jgi:DNA-binding NarL/FixJ family response regulator